MNTYGVHSIHGRAPAVATGVALARPDLEAAEHALIDAQLLPALGFWYIARHAA